MIYISFYSLMSAIIRNTVSNLSNFNGNKHLKRIASGAMKKVHRAQ